MSNGGGGPEKIILDEKKMAPILREAADLCLEFAGAIKRGEVSEEKIDEAFLEDVLTYPHVHRLVAFYRKSLKKGGPK